jgi:hypothetical protein
MDDNKPELQTHWSPDDWAEKGVARNLIPWWMVLMWGAFLLWGIAYIVDSASTW